MKFAPFLEFIFSIGSEKPRWQANILFRQVASENGSP